jgi:peptidyl-prolyl cis-trans isomerase A (cyclophilin A)
MNRRLLLAAVAVSTLVAPILAAGGSENPIVRMETSLGEIAIELDGAQAPATVANFLDYVKAGHYDGLVFHRVIGGFMIQGGGFDPQMRQRPTRAPIPNESANGLSNQRGTIAMARTSAPNSATAQFFINVVDNESLDRERAQDGWGYCVFGRVATGMDVVDRIAAVPTAARGPMRDVPHEPVVITRATLTTTTPKE